MCFSALRTWLRSQVNDTYHDIEGQLPLDIFEIAQLETNPANSVTIMFNNEEIFLSYRRLEMIKNIVADFLFRSNLIGGVWSMVNILNYVTDSSKDTNYLGNSALLAISIFGICISRYIKNYRFLNER